MFVELVYDKRNFSGLPGANSMILAELTKRIHRIFPDADVRVKPMMTLPAINTDASKHEKERINAAVQEMFEEADMWLGGDEIAAIYIRIRGFHAELAMVEDWNGDEQDMIWDAISQHLRQLELINERYGPPSLKLLNPIFEHPKP